MGRAGPALPGRRPPHPHALTSRPKLGRLAAATAGLLGLVVLVPLLALTAVAGSSAGPLAAPAGSGIPPVYVPLYQAAGRAFGVHWLLLASIHRQETDFSRSTLPGVRSGANGCGAAGPMQFGIVGVDPYGATAPDCGGLTGTGAGPTWRAYARAGRRLLARAREARYPLMRDRLPACAAVPADLGCVYADADAVAAGAMFLHALGARKALDGRAWEAARRYNGAGAYADLVLQRAREWQAQAERDVGGPDLPLVAGARARLGADGLARAPADAPPEVVRAIAAGNAINDRPYRLVHYPSHIGNPTYDCSSSTSHVLWGAGQFGTAPWVSGQLMAYGLPGPGRWITLWANEGHVFMTVAGLRFDTGRYDTGPNAGESGPRWRLGPRPTENFVVRHPRGL